MQSRSSLSHVVGADELERVEQPKHPWLGFVVVVVLAALAIALTVAFFVRFYR